MSYRTALSSQGLAYTPRNVWGAHHSYASRPVVALPGRYLFLHIAVIADPDDLVGTEQQRMRTLERIGVERFQSGISYNWAVFDSGRAYEGCPLDRKGAHTVNDKRVPGYPTNLNYFGFACVLPQMPSDDVTDAQIDGVARFGAACRRAKLTTAREWLPHQMFANKACPGARAMRRLDELNKITDHYTRVGLGQAEEGDWDMDEQQETRLAKKIATELLGKVIEGRTETVGSTLATTANLTHSLLLEQRRTNELLDQLLSRGN